MLIKSKFLCPVDGDGSNIPVEGGQNSSNSKSGGNPDSDPSGKPDGDSGDKGGSTDVVKYDSYKKLLDEKKSLASKHSDVLAKLAQYEADEKAREEKKAIEEKRFGDVLKTKEEEINKLRGTLELKEKNEQDYRKVHSFLNGLGDSKLESKYYSLIPLDEIRINEDGNIDQESLTQTVANFKTEHKRLLVTSKAPLPNNKTGDSSGKKLTPTQWRNLKSSKEMTARFNEVDWSAE